MADRGPIIDFLDNRKQRKYLVLIEGKYIHKGNANYILVGGSTAEVIYYPAAKIVRKIMHSTR